MKPLPWLDRCGFLNIRVWDFSGRSLLRAYGAAFLWKVVLRHPIKTFRGMRRYRRLIRGGAHTQERHVNLSRPEWAGGPESIVGVGYCLKPLDPPCPAGRFNHNCHFFERHQQPKGAGIPACCERCKIRQYGLRALANGSRFYIMTSAIDILHDVFLPALDCRKYRSGLFVLCRYSFDPFVLPLLMAGMDYALVPFESGDCRDYATWLEADVGVKNEQTAIAPVNEGALQSLLAVPDDARHRSARTYGKDGNVFRPS